jgi:hypothetical protein
MMSREVAVLAASLGAIEGSCSSKDLGMQAVIKRPYGRSSGFRAVRRCAIVPGVRAGVISYNIKIVNSPTTTLFIKKTLIILDIPFSL